LNIEQFKLYLSKKYANERVVGDAISRCKRVAKYEGNLDRHFEIDQGHSLLDRLTYSKKNADLQIEPRHSINIKGTKGYTSVYEGTLSLYRAVELYFDYRKKIY